MRAVWDRELVLARRLHSWAAMRRHPSRPIVWLWICLLAVSAVSAFAGPAELRRRSRPERVWEAGERGRPGADARPIIDATLRDAGLPEGAENNPWRQLIEQYFRLDHLAQGEPRSYTEGRLCRTRGSRMAAATSSISRC